MSETISSSALFHITGKITHIKNILSEGFFPHYCPEYTLDGADRKAARSGRHPTYAIPMVCFCDLPLSLIKQHLKEYGMYGIGLEKTVGSQERRRSSDLYTRESKNAAFGFPFGYRSSGSSRRQDLDRYEIPRRLFEAFRGTVLEKR